jgi:hypothetical protein
MKLPRVQPAALFDATVPRDFHVNLGAATAAWCGSFPTTLRATQPLTPHRNRWRVRVQRNTGNVYIGVVPAAPPAPRTMEDYGAGGYTISHLGGWEMESHHEFGGIAYSPDGDWALEDGATIPWNWFNYGRVVECALDFTTKTLQVACNGTVRRGVLVGWKGEATPLYPAVHAWSEGTVLELLP